VIVVSPDDTGIAQARAKTDRLDARTLARLLWSGELESVWMPDERCRVLRRRLARREQLVHSRSRAKNEIHAVLQRRLQGKPPCADLFGVKGRRWLAGLECRWRSVSPSRLGSVRSTFWTARSPRSSG
jgi:transposase